MKFLKTIAVDELRKILISIPETSFGEEIIDIDQSFNRVLSRDVKSKIDVPHFRKSTMDGYAVVAEDTFGAEEDNIISLELIETINAGDVPKKALNRKQCSYVSTGAPIPDNANGVVMVEFSEVKENKVFISKAITPGSNIVNIGQDIKKNDIIVKKDAIIDLATMGIFASCGISQIQVNRKPNVCLISTGNEIVSPSVDNLEIGKIYDVNSTILKKAIELTGANVIFLGIVKDNFTDLKNKIDEALEIGDVVILSGGTSKGEGDLGPNVLEKYDSIDTLVHGVRIKPGKPIIFAKMKNKTIFILPGFPTSALSCYYVFIEDFLRKLSRYPPKEKSSKEFEVGERIYGTVGRHQFKTILIREIEGIKKIFPIKTGTEAIITMFYADGYIEIDELESIIEKGDKRKVYFF